MVSALTFVYTMLLLLLITITLMLRATDLFVSALSPSLDHQETLSGSKKLTLVKFSDINTVGIHDGRRFYLSKPTNLSQCQMNNLPDISSVSYISDGRILNATFWLHQPERFNNTFSGYPLQNASQIHQQLLRIEVESSKYKTTKEAIINENKSLQRENFTDLKMVQYTPLGLNNNQAYKLEFTGKLKPLFGDFSIKLIDVVMVEDKKLYKIQFIAETNQYAPMLQTVNEIINSFQILKKQITMSNSPSNSPSAQNLEKDSKIITSTTTQEINQLDNYVNEYLDIQMKYPSSWNKRENINNNNNVQSVTFFSPVKGPYFLANDYSMSIDIPSYYDTHPDYIARIGWSDNPLKNNNNSWNMTIEELSSSAPGRIFYTKPNYNDDFKRERYVIFLLDLGKLNYPNQYNLMFSMDIAFVKDGYFCHLVSATNQVSIPPPIFYIIPSSNLTNVGPTSWAPKTVEIKVESLSSMNSLVSLYTSGDRSVLQNATFDPSTMIVPPYGSAVTELTIKPKADLFSTGWNRPSITKTLPILASINFSTPMPYHTSDINGDNDDNIVFIDGSKHIQRTVLSGLSITVFNSWDYILYLLNTWASPLNLFITLIAGIIGLIGGGLLKGKQK